jgi:AcrR family transcriptional regulator
LPRHYEGWRQALHRFRNVYRAALNLFKSKGYDKTSIQEIAEASNLQKGSLYHYINGKETLLFDSVYGTVKKMVEMIEGVRKEDLPPLEKLRRAIEMHLLTGTGFLNEFSLLIQETKYLSPKLRQKVTIKRNQYELAFREMIKEGIEEQVFKDLDPKIVSFMILGALNWLYQWYSPKGPLSPKEITNIFCQVFIDGMQRR